MSSHQDISRLSAADLASAMQFMPVGVTIIDRHLIVRYWNDMFCRLQGLPDTLMRPGVTIQELFEHIAWRGDYGPGAPDQQVRERIELVLRFEPHHFRRTRSDGTVLEITGRLIYDEQGEMTGFITIYQDVTQETRHQQQLEAKNEELQVAYEELRQAEIGYASLEEDSRKYYQMAVRDRLTNLFTRYYMEDAAGRLIEQHERNDAAQLGLVVFDIDHFKLINDTYGHVSGDAVLHRIGELISLEARSIDVAVRLGGDEFAIFLAGIGERDCLAFAGRIIDACAAIRFDGLLSDLRPTISVGVAEHRRGESLVQLIERADAALYAAKRAGRNGVREAG